MEERELIKEIIDLLRDGRMYFERILKEWIFIIISLILHYEDSMARGLFTEIFILDRPIFYIWYDIERELNEIKKKLIKEAGLAEEIVKKSIERVIEKRKKI